MAIGVRFIFDLVLLSARGDSGIVESSLSSFFLERRPKEGDANVEDSIWSVSDDGDWN